MQWTLLSMPCVQAILLLTFIDVCAPGSVPIHSSGTSDSQGGHTGTPSVDASGEDQTGVDNAAKITIPDSHAADESCEHNREESSSSGSGEKAISGLDRIDSQPSVVGSGKTSAEFPSDPTSNLPKASPTSNSEDGHLHCNPTHPNLIHGSTVWEERPSCMLDRTCVQAVCTYPNELGASVQYTEHCPATNREMGVFFSVGQVGSVSFCNGTYIAAYAEIIDERDLKYVEDKCHETSTLACEGSDPVDPEDPGGAVPIAYATKACIAHTEKRNCGPTSFHQSKVYTVRHCNSSGLPSKATAAYLDDNWYRAQLLVKVQGQDRFYFRAVRNQGNPTFNEYVVNDAVDVDTPFSYAELYAIVKRLKKNCPL